MMDTYMLLLRKFLNNSKLDKKIKESYYSSMSSNLKFGRSIMVCFSFCSMTFKQMSNNTWYVSRDFFGESRQYGEIAYEEI